MTPVILAGLLVAAPLDLPEARRAVERAFTAEVAGDFEGAEAALQALLEPVGGAEQTPGPQLVRAYLREMAQRRALTEPGTVEGWRRAHLTLRRRPALWRAMYWGALVSVLPQAERSLAELTVRTRLLKAEGADFTAFARKVQRTLSTEGVRFVADGAAVDLAIELDGSSVEPVRHRHEATFEGSYLIEDRATGRILARSRDLDRSSIRATAEAARSRSLRSLREVLEEDALFDLRQIALERLTSPRSESARP